MVAIVIPAYNEEKTIGEVVKEARKYGKVFVVDDASSDSTAEVARKVGARVLRQIINQGAGFTTRTGIEAAIASGADIIVTIDADGQHNPKDIPRLISTLTREKLDIVIGSRNFSKMRFTKRLGNSLIYLTSRILFHVDIIDTQSGFKAFRCGVWNKIKWNSSHYAFCSEIVKNIGINKLRYKEIPIETRLGKEYKGANVFDGIKIVLKMLWWKIWS